MQLLQGDPEMSDISDGNTEAEPLKKEGITDSPPGKTQDVRRLTRLSRWRTAVFFLSLFLCLTVVFAFSFIIPCPVRPSYLNAWNHTYPESATYEFLGVEDANRDKVLDVFFVLKATVGSLNTSCANESVPCVFVVAAAGTNGDTLWERPLAPSFRWAQCGLRGLGGTNSGCLLAHAQLLTAVDKSTGAVLWQRPHLPSLGSQLPVVMSPDLDGDGVDDLVLIGPGPMETKLAILSGKTGTQIGSEVVLVSMNAFKHLQHTTAAGSHYVLFQTASGMYAQALWRIAAQVKAGSEMSLRKDPTWEKLADLTSTQRLISKSAAVQWLVRIPKRSSAHSLLLVAGGTVELLDGDSLQSLWKVNFSSILSEPSTGYYNKDDIPDVVVEEDSGNGTKRVVILNGKSGDILWQVTMLVRPNTPRPVSFRSIHTVSVFVFWGQITSQHNASRSSRESTFMYMLHPQYPEAVLESSAEAQHIVAFKATLLEKGRHACFITLTGPEGAEPSVGSVTLSKHKLKDEVLGSRVHWLGGSSETQDGQYVKETFNNLRFH